MLSGESPISKFLAALDSTGKKPTRAGKGYKAHCPGHDDKSPSLSLSVGDDGRALVKCFAGCSTEEICAALGLTTADLFPSSERTERRSSQNETTTKPEKRFPTAEDVIAEWSRILGAPSGVWTYQNPGGEVVAAAIRFDQSDGGKEFRPVSRDGNDWFLKAPAGPRPLYRLPEIAGLPPEARVYVCEGEKAADAARELGLPATTSFGGSQAASKTDWSPLAGRDVVILPDHDEAGRKYAQWVQEILAGLNPRPTLRIVDLPDLPAGGDIVEFIAERKAAGDSATIIRDTVDELAEAAPVVNLDDVSRELKKPDSRGSLIVRRLSDVKAESVEWLWPNRVPLGKLTLLSGDPGLGKSFVTCDMAARVSRGAVWPDSSIAQPIGSVLVFNCEDGLADTVVPRLQRAGADLSKIVAIEGIRDVDVNTGTVFPRNFTMDRDLPRLAEQLSKLPDCRLVVIDPVSAYLGNADSHKNPDVRALLAPLSQLAEQHGVAIVQINHLSKAAGAKAIYRSMGSIGFAAASRAVWYFAKDLDNESRRLLLPAKMNLAPDPSGLAYEIKDGVVVWEPDPVEMTADEFVARETSVRAGPRELARKEVAEWLRERLSNGPVLSADIFGEGEKNGFPEKMLRRGLIDIGAEKMKSGMEGPWHWFLPSKPTATSQPNWPADSAPFPPEDAPNFPKLPGSENRASSPSSAKFDNRRQSQ